MKLVLKYNNNSITHPPPSYEVFVSSLAFPHCFSHALTGQELTFVPPGESSLFTNEATTRITTTAAAMFSYKCSVVNIIPELLIRYNVDQVIFNNYWLDMFFIICWFFTVILALERFFSRRVTYKCEVENLNRYGI